MGEEEKERRRGDVRRRKGGGEEGRRKREGKKGEERRGRDWKRESIIKLIFCIKVTSKCSLSSSTNSPTHRKLGYAPPPTSGERENWCSSID